MIELFLKGGPIMWPLLILSIVALTVVLERLDWPKRFPMITLPAGMRTAIVIAAVLMPIAGLSMLGISILDRTFGEAK